MEYFENKMRALFKEEPKGIPEGFSWDEMKPGINEKLENEEKIPTSSILNRRTYAIVGISFLMLFIALYFLKCGTSGQKKVNTSSSDPKEIAQAIPGDFQTSNLKQTNSDFQKKETAIQDQNLEQDISKNPIQKSSNNYTKSLILNKTKISKAGNLSSYVTDHSDAENTQNKIIKEASLLKESSPIDPFSKRKNGLLNINPLATKITFLSSKIPKFNKRNISVLPLDYQRNNCSLPSKGHFIGFSAGANLFNPIYGGDKETARIRNSNSFMILGQDLNIFWSRQIMDRNYITLSTGWSNMYEKLETSFDKMATVLVKDAIVKVDSNIITSRKTIFRKDTLVNSIERRNIVHYNKFRSINISVSFGRTWCLNDRLFLQGDFGLQYSRLKYSEGRQLAKNYEIIDFNSSNSIHSSNHFSLSADIGLFYKLSDKFYLKSNININKYVDNWSLENDIINLPIKYGLHFGMAYLY